MNRLNEYHNRATSAGLEPTHHVLIAHLGEKIMEHWEAATCVASLTFSYSRRPPSCVENSLGTPWGLHEVAEKYGDGAPPGTVFTGRVSTGQTYDERSDTGSGQPSLVTTRILRLRGLEQGLNAGPGIDSFERFIYIHGSNAPGRFPENLSAGCLLLRDEDLIRLYQRIPSGSHVLILR